VDWREDHNLYQPGFNFLSVGDHQRPLEPMRPRRSLAEWQEYWGLEDTGSLQGPIRFQREEVFPTLPEPIETVTADDFRLHPQSAGARAGEDGRDLGADVDLVGPGPAYERWRATPAYQEWRKAAEQTP
jgi:hypothetical protein